MNLGRVTLGQQVFLIVECTDAGIAYAPPVVPVVTVYFEDTKVVATPLPPVDLGTVTGLFSYGFYLGLGFSLGHYSAVVNYIANGVNKLEVLHFEIVAGGDPYGTVISMAFYPRPHANFLVEKLDSQNRFLARNPRGS